MSFDQAVFWAKLNYIEERLERIEKQQHENVRALIEMTGERLPEKQAESLSDIKKLLINMRASLMQIADEADTALNEVANWEESVSELE